MINKPSTFADWLLNYMNEKGMSQAELARAASVTPTAISDVINGKRKAGAKLCRGLAKALHLPVEIVYRAAGYLPPISQKSALQEQADHLYNSLTPENQQKALEYLEFLRLQEENETRREKPARKPRTSETG